MQINPRFKNLPYWLKGAFLGFSALILLILILEGFAMTKCPAVNRPISAYCNTQLFGQESLVLWLLPNNSIIKMLEANIYNPGIESTIWLYVDVAEFLLSILIGSIIGLIYGKIKKQNKNN
jgi:hypothetical protein